MKKFISRESISLKVCGVINQEDAERLVEMNVGALGVNFWPQSKRYCSEVKADFLKPLENRICRVGVFVNADKSVPQRLLDEGYIDVAQFHGDEDLDYCEYFADRDLPYFRAVGVRDKQSIAGLDLPKCMGILLDAYAPNVYGGTGETCDWSIIEEVYRLYPDLPMG